MAAEEPWAQYARKYTVHDETKIIFRMLSAPGAKSYSDLGVEGSRKMFEALSPVLSGDVEFDGEQTEITIPSPFTNEGIPVSVYKSASRPEVPAILLYFHGGGLVFGSRKTHETVVKILARDSGAIVLNVEYRLLPNPEAVYAPFEDAEVATKWVLANREKVGGKSSSKVGVGGDSAGGWLSVGVTNEVPGLDFQMLVYPFTDTSKSNDSFREFKDFPGLNEKAMKFISEHSTNHMPDHVTNPRINGMARTNTASSPPALIILAELDPLVGCGKEYAEKLRAAGVNVQLEIIKGVSHGFFTCDKIFKTNCAKAYSIAAKFLKQFQ